MRLSLLLIATTLLTACASSNPEGDTTVAQVADLAAAKGRLESEFATAKQRTERERAARIEAEVKLAVKTFELALAAYNSELMATVCDVRSGAVDGPTAEARVRRAGDLTKPFYEGCEKEEPANKCVARKARVEAERSTP